MARIKHQHIRRFVYTGVLAGALACIGLGSGTAGAQTEAAKPSDAAKTFVDTLYAERIDKVQRTRDSEDDLALMSEMLDIAPTLPTEPDARSALYVRIVQMLDRSRAGHGLALEALAELSKHNPKHPSAGPGARLDVYGLWYREADRSERSEIAEQYFGQLVVAADQAVQRGDHANAKQWYGEAASVQRVARVDSDIDLRERLVAARKVEKIDEEIAFLQGEAAKGELEPEQARRLIVLMTLELGRYEQAGAYTSFVKDDTFVKGFRSAVEIGGKQINDQSSDHPPGAWLKAGNWYVSLLDEPGLREKTAEQALVLARIALHRYVDTTAQETIEKARAAILVRRLDEQYKEKYGVSDDSNNLLRQLDPAKHVIGGKPFQINKGVLELPKKSIVHLPVDGGDHYRLKFKFQIIDERQDGLIVMMPVGDRMARLFVDAAHHRNSKFDGLIYVPESNENMLLKKGEEVSVRVEVKSFVKDDAALRLWFNDELVWNWRGDPGKLIDPPFGKPPEKGHISFLVGTNAKFSEITLLRLDEKE